MGLVRRRRAQCGGEQEVAPPREFHTEEEDEMGVNRIGFDVLADGKVVSTVLLGDEVALVDMVLDPLLGRKRGPFETMVFPREGNFSDIDCERYQTAAAAQEGHQRMVAKWAARIATAKPAALSQVEG